MLSPRGLCELSKLKQHESKKWISHSLSWLELSAVTFLCLQIDLQQKILHLSVDFNLCCIVCENRGLEARSVLYLLYVDAKKVVGELFYYIIVYHTFLSCAIPVDHWRLSVLTQ
uniref:Uncharacterized protein n=1 Tax=Romanomermis culicivorax TaxID=13658 RepID=A0A915J7T9_ROMCU